MNTIDSPFDTFITDTLSPVLIDADERQALLATPLCQLASINDCSTKHLQPETAQQVAHYLNIASKESWSVVLKPHHVGRSLHNTDSSDHFCWLELSQLKQVRAFHPLDMAITVEAGMRWADVQHDLNQQGYYIPLTYPADCSVSDILADDKPAFETGSVACFGGYPRDYVMGLEWAQSDGRIYRYGGLIVKNVTGYDMSKLLIGSRHTFGVITAATFKIYPKPVTIAQYGLQFNVGDLVPRLNNLLQSLINAQVPVQCFELMVSLSQEQNETGTGWLQLNANHPALLIEADKRLETVLAKFGITHHRANKDQPNSFAQVEEMEKKLALSADSLAFELTALQSLPDLLAQFSQKQLMPCPTHLRLRPMNDWGQIIWQHMSDTDPAQLSVMAAQLLEIQTGWIRQNDRMPSEQIFYLCKAPQAFVSILPSDSPLLGPNHPTILNPLRRYFDPAGILPPPIEY